MQGKRLGIRPASSLSSSSTPIHRGSSILKSLLIAGLAAFTFLAGIIVGTQFFDVHRMGESSRPWQDLVKSALLPPRLRGLAPGVRAATSPLALADGAAEPPAVEVGGEAPPEDEWPAGPTAWAPFSGKAGVQLSGPVDGVELSYFAWIYLDSSSDVADMKMIASNRAGGCTVDAAHRGFSFYVNSWGSKDGALVLEWRNSGGVGDGCARLASEPNTVPMDSWVHVGFAFQRAPRLAAKTAGTAMLFINGELLREAPSRRGGSDVQRGPAALPLIVGANTAAGDFGFTGKIGLVGAVVGVISPDEMTAVWRATGPGAWADALVTLGASHSLLLAVVLSSEGQADAVAAVEAESTGVLGFGGAAITVSELTGSVTLAGPGAQMQQPADGGGGAAGAGAGGGDGGDIVPPLPVPPPRQPAKRGSGGGAAISPPGYITQGGIAGTPPAACFDFSAGGNQWVPSMIRVPMADAAGSVSDPAFLAAGTFSDELTMDQLAASDVVGRQRALAVKAAMQHAWAGYKSHAWGGDELKPRSGTRSDNWAGIGMTLIDSLDTLWIMGMDAEFAEATAWVESSLSFDKAISVSVFETTIRALGGLLAAYDLSGKAVFLDKAKDLGNRLLPAFNTASGIPRAAVVVSGGVNLFL